MTILSGIRVEHGRVGARIEEALYARYLSVLDTYPVDNARALDRFQGRLVSQDGADLITVNEHATALKRLEYRAESRNALNKGRCVVMSLDGPFVAEVIGGEHSLRALEVPGFDSIEKRIDYIERGKLRLFQLPAATHGFQRLTPYDR